MNDLKSLLSTLPSQPGIYLFKDAQNQVLYVGKAKNLKKRVSSYFTSQLHDRPWTKIMVGLADDIETIVVDSELEALMLEATNIKKHMPRFNIMLTDDKSYPYIKLALKEAFPRFQIVRQQVKDGSEYFGPFLSARSATVTCEFLRKIYGVHLATRPITADRDRACLNCQLEQNVCPYNGEISEEQYMLSVERARNFLIGKRKTLIKDVEGKMETASQSEQYELAAKLRDQLRALRHVTERQQVISTTLDNYDAIGVAKMAQTASVVVLRVREGRVSSQSSFFFEITADQDNAGIIRQFLIGVYHNFTNLPPLTVLSTEVEDQALIESWLANLRDGRFELRLPERGEKRGLVDLAIKNAQAKLETRLLKSGQAIEGLVALKELLRLPELPYRIEAIDISNLGTSEIVGASVCFINGVPDKNEYRRYKIKYVSGQNDFASIQEVVSRRMSDQTRVVPDVLIIDGGPEQLVYAFKGLEGAKTPPKCIIALAKKPDRIFLPGKKLPVNVTRGNKGLLLLGQIRDEVHRFVITFHRHRQRKKSLQV